MRLKKKKKNFFTRHFTALNQKQKTTPAPRLENLRIPQIQIIARKFCNASTLV